MNTLDNIKAFILVARTGSFSAAARELGIAPSVITKRITRLEDQMGEQLVIRSTRGLKLSDAGDRILPRYQQLVTELEDLLNGNPQHSGTITGHLRIKSPTTITSLYLGPLFCEYHARNPSLSMEVMLMDRSVNPMDEGYDMAIAASPTSYPHVADVPLAPYPLVLCCAPSYLRERDPPREPRDLVEHECLTSMLLGNTWSFEHPRGNLSVEIHARFHANDARIVRESVLRGSGIAPVPRYLITEDFARGDLLPILQDYPLATLWLKALVPNIKMNKPPVRELVNFLRQHMQPRPPWDTA